MRESSPARRLPGETAAHIGERRVSFQEAQSSCRTFCDRQESHRTTQSASGLASHPTGGASGKLSDVDRRDVDSSFLPGFVRPLSSPPFTGGRGEGNPVQKGSAGQRRSRRRERGTQPCPCMGRHSSGVAEGSPAVSILVHGLLSVGTLERPDLGHLVDDFQRADKDKQCSGRGHM